MILTLLRALPTIDGGQYRPLLVFLVAVHGVPARFIAIYRLDLERYFGRSKYKLDMGLKLVWGTAGRSYRKPMDRF